MGIAPVPPQQITNNTFSASYVSSTRLIFIVKKFLRKLINILLQNYQLNNSEDNAFLNQNLNAGIRGIANEDESLANNANTSSAVTGFDLESELREFLESDSALSSFNLPDDVDDTDKTIEQMLSAHS